MDRKFQMQEASESAIWNDTYPCVKADCFKGFFGIVDGHGANYTINLNPMPEEYVPGMLVFGRILHPNDTTTLALKIHSPGIKNPNFGVNGQADWIPVKKRDGSKTFAPDEIKGGTTQMFLYDGFEWVLL